MSRARSKKSNSAAKSDSDDVVWGLGINSYAQNFEDVMLWRALGQVKEGFYIDVGAQDPVIDSVSLAFYEHGWHGLHVEPVPHYANLLRQQRPGDTVIQAALGDAASIMRFYEIPGTGISTADPAIAARHEQRGFQTVEALVPCMTLASLFESVASREIHWLKIDVEGFERQVLLGWGKSSVRPWIVVVESTLPLTQVETHESWEALLFQRGYEAVYFDGLNRFYVSAGHLELKKAFSSPPNVFDSFTLNGTASAPYHKHIEAHFEAKMASAYIEREQAREATKREVETLSASLSSSDEAAARHVQEGARQQAELTSRIEQKTHELDALLRQQAQREIDVGAQVAEIHTHAANERAKLARAHQEELDAMRSGHEHTQQLLAGDVAQVRLELLVAARERVQREATHAAELLENRLEIERLQLRLAQREQELAAQLLLVTERAAVDAADLEKIHQEERLHLEQRYHERERSLTGQLLQMAAAQRKAEEHFAAQIAAQEQLERTWSELLAHAESLIQQERVARQALERTVASNLDELAAIRRTRSWKMTAPFRSIAGLTRASSALPQRSPSDFPPQLSSRDSSMASLNYIPFQSDERAARVTSLRELLQLNGRNFVDNAYRLLLNRTPDSEGLAYYQGRLRGGVSKIRILRQLSASTEGRAAATRVPHVKSAILIQQLAQLPVLGTAIRHLFELEGDSAAEIRLRAVEQNLFEFREFVRFQHSDTQRSIDSLKQLVGLAVEHQSVALAARQPDAAHVVEASPVATAPAPASQTTESAPVVQPVSLALRPIVLQKAGAQEVLRQLAEQLPVTLEAQQLARRGK